MSSKPIDKQRVFEYLDDLQKEGSTNMFGAAPYVQQEFGVTKREARALVVEWMDTYDSRHQE